MNRINNCNDYWESKKSKGYRYFSLSICWDKCFSLIKLSKPYKCGGQTGISISIFLYVNSRYEEKNYLSKLQNLKVIKMKIKATLNFVFDL